LAAGAVSNGLCVACAWAIVPSLPAIRSREGRAFAPPIVAFFVMLAVAAMLGEQESVAGAARAKAGIGQAGKAHRRHAKPRCVVARPKRTHGKSRGTSKKPRRRGGEVQASRLKVSGPHKVVHARKPKKCPAARHPSKQPLIVVAPFAPLQPSSPGGVDPTPTPTPGPAATVPPGPATTAPPKLPPVEEPTSKQEDCIRKPSACGYPDTTNTGVPAGTTLTPSSDEITVTKAGTTISGIALTSSIAVDADDTTIKDSEITVDGTQTCGESCGGRGIWIAPGITGTTVEHVTCHGGAASGDDVTQYCIDNNSSSTKVSYLYAYNCTECFTGPGSLSDSFLDVTGTIPGEHYEDIYYGGGAGPLIVNHNTMLNPQAQTAVVFASVDFGDLSQLTITDNLMAGGGYVIYGGGSGSGGSVTGPITVTGNRFSRIYYPDGGSCGLAGDFVDEHTTWSDNIWDETLTQAPE
jgi:hypothetical protein